MKKKILSALLALCLMLGLLPVGAFAEGEQLPAPCTKDPACSLGDGHEGGCVLYETIYQVSGNGAAYGTLADACKNVCSDGVVIVLRDIELKAGVTITKPMTLTSAGDAPYTITYSPKNRGDYLLTANASGQVGLANIILDGGREDGSTSHAELVGVQGGSMLYLLSGAVIQNNDNVDTAKGAGGLRAIDGTAVMQTGSVIRTAATRQASKWRT